MTISKKSAFFLTCALSMQFFSQAYDAVGLKTEVAQILDFAKECYKHNTPETKNIAEWLEKNINEYNTDLRNTDVIAIAKALNANTTIDAKLMIISQIMAAKAVHKAWQEKADAEYFKKTEEEAKWNQNVRNAGMALGIIAMLAAGFIYDCNAMVRFTDMMAHKLVDEWEKRESKNVKKA